MPQAYLNMILVVIEAYVYQGQSTANGKQPKTAAVFMSPGFRAVVSYCRS